MIEILIREFVIPILIFLFLRAVMRSLFAGFRRPASRPAPRSAPPPAHAGGLLHKDPVCGTYVSDDAAISQSIGAEVVYFCSPECRDRYRQAR